MSEIIRRSIISTAHIDNMLEVYFRVVSSIDTTLHGNEYTLYLPIVDQGRIPVKDIHIIHGKYNGIHHVRFETSKVKQTWKCWRDASMVCDDNVHHIWNAFIRKGFKVLKGFDTI
jgi:hypothetical protein